MDLLEMDNVKVVFRVAEINLRHTVSVIGMVVSVIYMVFIHISLVNVMYVYYTVIFDFYEHDLEQMNLHYEDDGDDAHLDMELVGVNSY